MTTDQQAQADPDAAGTRLPPGVAVVRLVPGRMPTPEKSLDRNRAAGNVLWVDVQPTTDPESLLRLLWRLDGRITPELVRDLLDRDELAKACDTGAGIRNVSVVGMTARPSDSDSPGEVVFQMVETLVGDGWLVTCWQDAVVCTGTAPSSDAEPIFQEYVGGRIGQAWARDGLTTAGDVATALVHALAEQFRPAHRMLEHWLQVWELEFHAEGGEDSRPLKQLLAMVNESRRRLAAFNNMRCLTADRRWFPYVSSPAADLAADDLLDRALASLQILFENVRADMELVCMEQMVRQAASAEALQKADRSFQNNLGRVTALLLVPTLIAGIFGANTALPGGGTWLGFDTMVALMIGTSALVYLLLVRRNEASSD